MAHSLKVNDILSATWGYDQTNWDFYRVEKVTPSMVYLVRLTSVESLRMDKSGTYSMTGTVIPGAVKNDKVSRRKVHTNPNAKDSDFVMIDSFTLARKWSGRPKHYTSYA